MKSITRRLELTPPVEKTELINISLFSLAKVKLALLATNKRGEQMDEQDFTFKTPFYFHVIKVIFRTDSAEMFVG